MPLIVEKYIHFADRLSCAIGRFSLYIIYLIMGILLYSTCSRYIFDTPVIWGVELAQFCMVAYYILGGGFALLMNSHVRLDVFYSRWSKLKQARSDAFTSVFLLIYLGFLLYGCVSSTIYSIEFNQHNNTAWGPLVWPIKVIMGFGIVVTLLQAIAEFFKVVARSMGIEVNDDIPERLIVEGSEDHIVEDEPEPVFGIPVQPATELALDHYRAARHALSRSGS